MKSMKGQGGLSVLKEIDRQLHKKIKVKGPKGGEVTRSRVFAITADVAELGFTSGELILEDVPWYVPHRNDVKAQNIQAAGIEAYGLGKKLLYCNFTGTDLYHQDIADEIGMDISTISRSTRGKYVDTPYGIYDNDVAFISESVDVAKYVARKLGHPVMQLEFNSSSIYACFEESISDYSQYINNYNGK